MKQARDIQSLSTFKRDTAKIMRQLKKTGQPVVLTVKGKAELIVQDAETYQRLLERLDRVEAIEGIRRGLESMKRNAGKPAEEFFNEGWMNKASESANEPITNVPQKSVLPETRRKSFSRESAGVLRALRRAAKRALELGIKTGTPVYVMRNNKIVDLTKEQPAARESPSKRTSAKKSSK